MEEVKRPLSGVAKDPATIATMVTSMGNVGYWKLAVHLLERANFQKLQLDSITVGVTW